MNDRFKFRVWSNKNNIYIVDSHYPIGSDHIIVIRQDGKAYNLGLGDYEDYSNMHSWAVMEEFTDCIIEQCTGLKDKNGNLIYEGDVVLGSSGFNYKIIWSDMECGWALQNLESKVCIAMNAFTADEIEIIGNVHQTKE